MSISDHVPVGVKVKIITEIFFTLRVRSQTESHVTSWLQRKGNGLHNCKLVLQVPSREDLDLYYLYPCEVQKKILEFVILFAKNKIKIFFYQAIEMRKSTSRLRIKLGVNFAGKTRGKFSPFR